MSDPEFLPIRVLAERFNMPLKTLAARIEWMNRKKAGTVRKRGPAGQLKEYALDDVRAIAMTKNRKSGI